MNELDSKGVHGLESSRTYKHEHQAKALNFNDKVVQMHETHQSNNSMLKQNMHDAMSPLSAIGGYLELIDISLGQTDVEKIRYYRDKIESGINQVNDILIQLQKVYNEAERFDDEILDVDLNWIVSEIRKELNPQNSIIELDINSKPIHIKADLYIIKLAIFKMINFSAKCAGEDAVVELNTTNDDTTAVFASSFKVSDLKRAEIEKVLESSKSTDKSDFSNHSTIYEGLEVCTQLVKQMNGTVDIKPINHNKIQLYLSIPLSYPK